MYHIAVQDAPYVSNQTQRHSTTMVVQPLPSAEDGHNATIDLFSSELITDLLH